MLQEARSAQQAGCKMERHIESGLAPDDTDLAGSSFQVDMTLARPMLSTTGNKWDRLVHDTIAAAGLDM